MKSFSKKLIALSITPFLIYPLSSCSKKNNNAEMNSESNTNYINNNTKTEITIGMVALNSILLPAISEFNNTNNDYNITVVNYSKLAEDDDENNRKAFNLMKMDIISGKAPDIILTYPGDMAQLIQMDAFADMYKLMEEFDGVKKNDFIPNILKGFEYKDEIPAISYGFSIKTAAAKTSIVGAKSENWSIQQAIDTYKSKPDDVDFLFSEWTDFDMPNYIMEKASRKCVDLENYTCDFTVPEFAKLLDFLSEIPKSPNVLDSVDNEDFEILNREMQMSLINNKSIVNEFQIDGINDTLGWNICSYFMGDDITYVGYPSDDGCGAVTEAKFMFGILENSQNKAGSWEFINSLLSENFQKNNNEVNSGLPVIQSVLENAAFDTSKDNYFRAPLMIPNGTADDTISVSDEAAAKIVDYIETVEFEPYYDIQIKSIIKEEYSAVLAGEKSGAECAEILQSRLSIYLSEKQ